MKKLVLTLAGLLGAATSLLAQLPTNSFAVTSACPGSARNPSVLSEVNTDGTLTTIGNIRAGGNNIIVNGLGYDNADPTALFGMRVIQPVTLSSVQIPPTLYRINLTTAQADSLGPVTPPPAPTLPPVTFPEFLIDEVELTFNFIGDGGLTSNYFVGGATFRIILGAGGPRVSDLRLYVGEVQLPSAGVRAVTAPVWRQLNTSEPGTAAVIAAYQAQVQVFVAGGGTGTVPEGGIQDWIFNTSTGSLISYLGQENKFLTITNPGSNPVAITTTPSAPINPGDNIGSMFADRNGNVYAVSADDGTIYRIDPLTGNFTGLQFPNVLGCYRGDAVSLPGALPLPVRLVGFTAQAQGSKAALDWTTAWEENVREFRVERRTDARTAWQAVATVPAANAAQGRRYSALDPSPESGLNYYRLAVIDFDGTTSYSEVRSVVVEAAGAALALYPNPTAGEFTAVLGSAATGPVQVLNSLGQVVRELPAQGQTVVRGTLDNLPAGTYLLRTTGSRTPTTQRLFLMR
ncbi:T9SS type A sorting domain-containing protein [Hymenobacter weizhouensis]|uniref:T9SS type A sorting domain-containing protein n=1 Tax=Hymenobacter sp. YIM 151500-1 TaxID=2987689 RepID=UPI00222637E1|nr:T9SS type A sorting domain-containing protein [Hymenobacter sp. YIM 151500-1]UYZ64678.1 T9SS type A sorting domain-containing protein [Hymenobacter sp. YIM 151500-1]